jgi:hypothetical protein
VFEFSRRQLNTPIIIESKQCKQHFKINPFEPFVLHDCIFGNIVFNLGLEFSNGSYVFMDFSFSITFYVILSMNKNYVYIVPTYALLPFFVWTFVGTLQLVDNSSNIIHI